MVVTPFRTPRACPINSVIARADSCAHDLIAWGAADDETPAFPQRSLARLAQAGLLSCFAPPQSGGTDWGDKQTLTAAMFEVLRRIGRADLSLGRLYEGHVNAMLLFRALADQRQFDWLKTQLDCGDVFGIWASEPQPGVRLERNAADGGLRLTGAKHFASGAGHIAHALITAQPSDGPPCLVIVPGDLTDRTDASRWQVRGMRSTLSGSYDLHGIQVSEDMLLGEPGEYGAEPDFTAGAWRFCAVQLGGVEGLLQVLKQSAADDLAQDPVKRARFGDAVVATRTAYLWVREAMLRFGRSDQDGAEFVLMTRGVVERAALDVMEHASRLLGTRSAMNGQRADKIIRDLSLYLRQAQPDHARDRAALAWLDHDAWGEDALW